MPPPRASPGIAALVLVALFVLDRFFPPAISLIPLFVLGPLVAALGSGPRGTAAIGLLAVGLAVVDVVAWTSLDDDQDAVRVITVALGSALAVWIALLQQRLHDAAARYETLLQALSEVGEGMVVTEEDGRCVYVNAAFEQLSGRSFAELAALPSLLDLVEESDRDEARRRAVGRVRRGLVEPGYGLAMRRPDGTRVDVEVAGVPLEADGRRRLVIVVRDVTGRRRAEAERERVLARSALLAEASELFDQTLDQEQTIDSVARLCVRDLADTCVIVVGDAPARLSRVVAVARDEALEPRLAAALREDPLDDRPEHPMLTVRRGGEGIVAASPEGLGTTRSVTVPLRARGRLHGVLMAGFAQLPAADERHVLSLFEDLGRRAALALDSAQLYAERDEVARTLQRSLLPTELPEIPGVELAARYLAAGAGNEVGGDFYDCFATGGGDWALVIGDVCGKGAEAAAVTALARYTLRAAVLHTRRPQAVLGQLNEALLRQGLDYRFCTVLYASLTPRDGHVAVTLATGGHPLPLVLRAGGRVETAGTAGTLLGIIEDPDISEESLVLEPGDALVLFTDGVIEASAADREIGPDRFAGFLAGCAGSGAASIAAAVELEARGTHGQAPRDDVAVLVARVHGDGSAPFGAIGEGVAQTS